MITCCGQERSTNYCPDCGKLLANLPLTALLNYLHTMRAQAKGRLDKITARTERRLGEVARANTILQKWDGWAQELAALLKREDDRASPD